MYSISAHPQLFLFSFFLLQLSEAYEYSAEKPTEITTLCVNAINSKQIQHYIKMFRKKIKVPQWSYADTYSQ